MNVTFIHQQIIDNAVPCAKNIFRFSRSQSIIACEDSMQTSSRKPALILLCVLLLALTACGPGNSVRLLPSPPIQESALPSPTAPSVSVVNFTDKRVDPNSVGVRRDGSSFTTQGDVAQWISRALADQLARDGLRVTYALDTTQARNGHPDYLVTGAIDDVWLKENSAMELSATMRVNITLANRKAKLWNETSTTTQTKAGLPSGAAADNLLAETLRELLRPIAGKIVQTIETKK